MTLASRTNMLDVVSSLIDHGANLDSEAVWYDFMCTLSYSQSSRALRAAIENGNMKLTTFLLDNGVDVNAECDVRILENWSLELTGSNCYSRCCLLKSIEYC